MTIEPEINPRGNSIERRNGAGSRYAYDTRTCRHSDGWRQYDTDSDAWYFGVWVHTDRREIVTYAEGDESRVTCPTVESFAAELASMGEFYGEAPPSMVLIAADGTVTNLYDPRPTAGEVSHAG